MGDRHPGFKDYDEPVKGCFCDDCAKKRVVLALEKISTDLAVLADCVVTISNNKGTYRRFGTTDDRG